MTLTKINGIKYVGINEIAISVRYNGKTYAGTITEVTK